jgi:hypothetical protein
VPSVGLKRSEKQLETMERRDRTQTKSLDTAMAE